MRYIRMVWEWLMKHSVSIIIGLLVFLYAYANVQTIKFEQQKSEDDFRCQTLCFPQQHEYLYAGDTASCWCYENRSTLKKLEN